MSKKKARKNSEQGTYAICITAGLVVGLGLGPLFGSVLASSAFGMVAGGITGYLINHRKSSRKK